MSYYKNLNDRFSNLLSKAMMYNKSNFISQ